MSRFTQAGNLSVRLGLEQNFEIADGCGGFANQWSHAGDVWARIEPVTTRLETVAAAQEGRISHHIIMRFRDDVSRDYRLVKGMRIFLIINAYDPDESGRYLLCECEEIK